MSTGVVLAHGVGSREDLPLPFSYVVVGAATALVVSFVVLLLFWREPRLASSDAGQAVPDGVQRVLDAGPMRAALRLLGLAGTTYFLVALFLGKDNGNNPSAATFYVLFWVGVPVASLLLGPVWRLLNPVRTLHLVLSRLVRADPDDGLSTLPHRLGYWPAAVSLLTFVWLELVPSDVNTTLTVMRIYVVSYGAIHLVAATYYGSSWFARGDGFEVFSTLLGRMSVLGRRDDGRLVLRSPLSGVAGTPHAPGLFALVGVLLGGTVFDSITGHLRWVTFVQDSSVSPRILGTAGLVVTVTVVTAAFAGASALTGTIAHRPALATATALAHSIVPVVAGYFIAHYWSLLVLIGQQAVISLSDPLDTGANLLGTSGRHVDPMLAGPTVTSVVQVGAIVTGHVLGVVLAHDRCMRLLPRTDSDDGRRQHVIAGQLPLMVLMLAYTVTGLLLLFS